MITIKQNVLLICVHGSHLQFHSSVYNTIFLIYKSFYLRDHNKYIHTYVHSRTRRIANEIIISWSTFQTGSTRQHQNGGQNWYEFGWHHQDYKSWSWRVKQRWTWSWWRWRSETRGWRTTFKRSSHALIKRRYALSIPTRECRELLGPRHGKFTSRL